MSLMYSPVLNITTSLLNSISSIEASKAVIANAPLIPLYERQFRSDAVARKVHFSTAIEGNYLKLHEVKAMVEGEVNEIFEPRKRDLYEVINYREVVEFIEKLSNEYKTNSQNNESKFLLTEDILKYIHSILLKNIDDHVCGKYRTDIALTVNYATGEKYYPYEEPAQIELKLKELLEWFNEAGLVAHPVIRAALMHLELVRIHPFNDANGRLARAIATLVLSLEGYDVNHFFCLDEYYDSNASDYYFYLGEGFINPTPWLEYFATGMAIEFNRIKDRVLKLSKDAKIRERSGGQMFVTPRQEKIIEWINDRGYFRNQDFELVFPQISEDTVLRELKGLIESDILEKRGKTKSARYEFK